MTSTQHHRNGRHAKLEPPPAVPSLPLTTEYPPDHSQASMGELVREATTHLSTLMRSEVELAKAELTAEVRKGVKGSILFIVALSILIFSLFFLFIALGEVIAVWLPRWASFSIVFGLMVLAAAGCALFGWRRVRSVRKPERTITTVKESGAVLSHLRPDHQHDGQRRSHRQPSLALPDPQHGNPQQDSPQQDSSQQDSSQQDSSQQDSSQRRRSQRGAPQPYPRHPADQR